MSWTCPHCARILPGINPVFVGTCPFCGRAASAADASAPPSSGTRQEAESKAKKTGTKEHPHASTETFGTPVDARVHRRLLACVSALAVSSAAKRDARMFESFMKRLQSFRSDYGSWCNAFRETFDRWKHTHGGESPACIETVRRRFFAAASNEHLARRRFFEAVVAASSLEGMLFFALMVAEMPEHNLETNQPIPPADILVLWGLAETTTPEEMRRYYSD